VLRRDHTGDEPDIEQLTASPPEWWVAGGMSAARSGPIAGASARRLGAVLALRRRGLAGQQQTRPTTKCAASSRSRRRSGSLLREKRDKLDSSASALLEHRPRQDDAYAAAGVRPARKSVRTLLPGKVPVKNGEVHVPLGLTRDSGHGRTSYQVANVSSEGHSIDPGNCCMRVRIVHESCGLLRAIDHGWWSTSGPPSSRACALKTIFDGVAGSSRARADAVHSPESYVGVDAPHRALPSVQARGARARLGRAGRLEWC